MAARLITFEDTSRDDVREILDLSRELAAARSAGRALPQPLAGRRVALLFDEPSMRTRSAFEIAAVELGATTHSFTGQEARFSRGGAYAENLADLGAMLSGFYDLVLVRVYDHQMLRALSAHLRTPLINGMCDLHHPTQALCDAYTIEAHKGTLADRKVVFLGDFTNVARSNAELVAKLGSRLVVSCPPAVFESDCDVADLVAYEPDPRAAARDADVIISDVWTPMNSKRSAETLRAFEPYRVDESLCSLARPDFVFMHNLPAYRGVEVTASIIDGPNSIVYPEALARLAIARGLLTHLEGAR